MKRKEDVSIEKMKNVCDAFIKKERFIIRLINYFVEPEEHKKILKQKSNDLQIKIMQEIFNGLPYEKGLELLEDIEEDENKNDFSKHFKENTVAGLS